MKTPLVSVIIVGFNAKHFLPKCLGTLLAGSYKNIEVLYIDNGSEDGTSAYIRKYYPTITLLQNGQNLGFSPAHEGILEKTKGDAILLLNTDTILKKNLLFDLVKALYERENIGAVQPQILMYPEKNKLDSAGSFLLLNGLLYHVGYDKDASPPLYNKPMEIFSTKGAIMLIRKKVLEKVSFPPTDGHESSIFDNDYFTAFEDTDLCHRIWLAGYRILYVPSAKAYHIGGGATNKMLRSFVRYHSEKNRLATYLKNLSTQYLFVMLPRILIMLQLESLGFLLLKRRIDIAWAIERAILWNIVHLRQILAKRRYVQKHIRAVSDSDFLPKLIRPVRLSYYFYLLFGLQSYKD